MTDSPDPSIRMGEIIEGMRLQAHELATSLSTRLVDGAPLDHTDVEGFMLLLTMVATIKHNEELHAKLNQLEFAMEASRAIQQATRPPT